MKKYRAVLLIRVLIILEIDFPLFTLTRLAYKSWFKRVCRNQICASKYIFLTQVVTLPKERSWPNSAYNENHSYWINSGLSMKMRWHVRDGQNSCHWQFLIIKTIDSSKFINKFLLHLGSLAIWASTPLLCDKLQSVTNEEKIKVWLIILNSEINVNKTPKPQSVFRFIWTK